MKKDLTESYKSECMEQLIAKLTEDLKAEKAAQRDSQKQ